jgi:hypothetical protein
VGELERRRNEEPSPYIRGNQSRFRNEYEGGERKLNNLPSQTRNIKFTQSWEGEIKYEENILLYIIFIMLSYLIDFCTGKFF